MLEKNKRSKESKIINLKDIKNRNLRKRLSKYEKDIRQTLMSLTKAKILETDSVGFMLAENELEKTYKVKQVDILKQVDLASKKKSYTLNIDKYGPFQGIYSRSGTHLLITSRKGHCALLDWKKFKQVSQVQLRETILDSTFLHNYNMFATAQRDYVYIYDKFGTELHCLKKHRNPRRVEFLPYHFLLASSTVNGILNYQDISTGLIAVSIKAKSGPLNVMTQNPYNAVLCLGQTNGTVSMWVPSMSKPVARMLCHCGPTLSIAVNKTGQYMVTSGADGKVKIWDIRKFQPLNTYTSHKPAVSLAISQTNILAVGFSQHCELWRDPFIKKQHKCYMKHIIPATKIQNVDFCSHEDILGIGHSNGFESLIIPGSGDPALDTFEANPYGTQKQLNNQVVYKLLDKLQPEMIQLNPNFVGKIALNIKLKTKKHGDMQKDKIKLHLKRSRYNIRREEQFNIIKQLKNKNEGRKKRRKELEKKFNGRIKSALDRFIKR